ncbi:MAG: methyltransferase domain-containing protein [Patescibacteria group bacterium]
MHWLSYLFPQAIFRASSKYNHDIRVIEEHGKYKLLVNGSRQSGAYIEMLWKEAFKSFGLPQSHLQEDLLQILVLGVAGGTVIHLLREMYSDALIVGVDIDTSMIAIGRTYFGLSDMKNVTLLQGDAQRFVADARRQNVRYDAIVVDLFLGRTIPSFVKNPSFLFLLKSILSRDGWMVMNYLRELEYEKQSQTLEASLKKIFSNVSDFSIVRNRFFSVVQ